MLLAGSPLEIDRPLFAAIIKFGGTPESLIPCLNRGAMLHQKSLRLNPRERKALRVEKVSLKPESNHGGIGMWNLIWVVIIGLIVGALAKLIMPGRDPGGVVVTILLGIAGSFVGSLLGRALGFYGPRESAGFVVSTLGAILLLALYRLVVSHRHPSVGVHH
jgi:uncharacterized membrane protein YeaQ/YmgE (transglycosylase-associated protein family)